MAKGSDKQQTLSSQEVPCYKQRTNLPDLSICVALLR